MSKKTTGAIRPLPEASNATISRFWGKVKKGDGCWEWQGKPSSAGYGVMAVRGRAYLAHRLAYFWFRGANPGSLFVCHECDNPICVRPDHLSLGDNSSNLRDAVKRGLRRYDNQPHGQRHHAAKLSAADVIDIRRRRAAGESCTSVAKLFGVSKGNISHITRGRNWRKG